MGSCISAIDDDFDFYEDMCKYLGIKMTSKWNFYEHMDRIIKENGNDGKYNVICRLKKRYNEKR